LPEPGVVTAIAAFGGNVAANLGTDFLKRLGGSGAETFARTFIGLDKNNHVAKGVRRAHLASLRAFLDQWRKTLPKPGFFKRVSSQDQLDVDFANTLGDWLDREQQAASIEAWASAVHAGAGDAAAHGQALREAFEKAFGAETTDSATIAQRAEKARGLAERQALEELVAGVLSFAFRHFEPEAPARFREAFLGGAQDAAGWFGLFLRAIGEEFKKDEEFKKLWETMQLAGVNAMAAEAVALCRKILEGKYRDAGLRPVAMAPAYDIEARPTNVLLARHRVVPFTDFGGRLAELLKWADPRGALPASAAGRLYVGGGGVGKTRLALALADALAKKHGWLCVEVSRGAVPNEVWRAMEAIGNISPPGVLAIVDYAEGRPEILEKLAEAAIREPGAEGHTLRILALARTNKDWWQAAQTGRGMGIFATNPFNMDAAHAQLDTAQRADLFVAAEKSFRAPLAEQNLAGAPPARPNFAANAYDRPLALLMAAYLSARGVGAGDGSNLFEYMLIEEEHHWKRVLHLTLAGPEDDDRIEPLRRGSAQITFLQGVSEGEARDLLMADHYFDRKAPADCGKAIKALKRLYPGDGGHSDYIGAIEPDILGEAAIARLVEKESAKGLELFAATLLAVLNWPDAERSVNAARSALEVVRRIGTHPESPTRAAAAKIIRHLEGLCAMLDHRQTSLLRDAMPWATVDLRRAAAIIAERAVPASTESANEQARHERARSLVIHAKRQADLGHREEAVKMGEEAVAIYRELAAGNRDAFLPDLAMSLNNVGAFLSSLGRRDEALRASEEAVAIYRELAAGNRDAFLPDLAMSLNNVGAFLSSLGRRDEALRASEEAVAIRRELAAGNRDAFLPDLALSLCARGDVLTGGGQFEEASESYFEGLQLYLGIIQIAPDEIGPRVQSNLGNMVAALRSAGKNEAEIAAILKQLGLDPPPAGV
jgi:tetratricopeptide (TPR) repeat protein